MIRNLDPFARLVIFPRLRQVVPNPTVACTLNICESISRFRSHLAGWMLWFFEPLAFRSGWRISAPKLLGSGASSSWQRTSRAMSGRSGTEFRSVEDVDDAFLEINRRRPAKRRGSRGPFP